MATAAAAAVAPFSPNPRFHSISLNARPATSTFRYLPSKTAKMLHDSFSQRRFQARDFRKYAASLDEVVSQREKGEELNSCSGCKACGRAEMEKGCNGDGRIQGGIGAIPGFTWWPIKAYRPCPAFVQSGGKYKRLGQNMDEVAFGRTGSASK
eukprot:TRINITY_DN4770_c0_g1_i1.p1 TRINITY_DN4770_c0_g1~~TRINITY_DN4770_c0_g1_i1.p1  ORF type:complete len:153 (+),score=27.92 TRINITY_DN4770_c0_g1_i1:105-563(+)